MASKARIWRYSHERNAQSVYKGVYVVTDAGLRPDRTLSKTTQPPWRVAQASFNSVTNPMSSPALSASSEAALQVHHRRNLFIVNDRVEVALASDADGVHLGPDDMRPKDARRLLGPEKLVGVSAGTLEEANAAAPMRPTSASAPSSAPKTKLDAGEPVGVERIREIKAAFPHIPIVAIGGINAGNIAEVRGRERMRQRWCRRWSAPDMEAATRELVRLFAEGKCLPQRSLRTRSLWRCARGRGHYCGSKCPLPPASRLVLITDNAGKRSL